MKLDEAQRRFARLCLGREASPDDVAALGEGRRWALYRAMVRGRFVDTLGDALPRLRGALGPAHLEAAVASFLADAPPATRYVRELSLAFARHLEAHPELAAGAPPWALDLARYEAAIMHAHVALDPDGDAVTDFDMALPAALSPSQRLVRAAWGVHAAEPEAGAWALLVSRNPEGDAVETLVLNPIAADLYEALGDGAASVTACVTAVLARHGAAAGAAFIESFAALLGDLMDRGILLGARRPA